MADQTFAEQMVEKIEAALLGKADNDVLEYMINGRQIKKYALGELEAMRQKYKREVQQEKINADLAEGLGNPRRKVLTRFKD